MFVCSSVKSADGGITNKADGDPEIVNAIRNHAGQMHLFIFKMNSGLVNLPEQHPRK